MSKKMALPDELLDAVAGGVMKIGGPDGETVTDFDVSTVGGVTTATVSTDAGRKYSLETRMMDERHLKSFMKQMHEDKSGHSLESWGKLTPIE